MLGRGGSSGVTGSKHARQGTAGEAMDAVILLIVDDRNDDLLRLTQAQ